MRRRVVRKMYTDVSEEGKSLRHLLVSFLSFSQILKMKAIRSPEMSADFYQSTRCYNTDNSTLDSHRCENLQSDLSS
jgi:uridine kinase